MNKAFRHLGEIYLCHSMSTDTVHRTQDSTVHRTPSMDTCQDSSHNFQRQVGGGYTSCPSEVCTHSLLEFLLGPEFRCGPEGNAFELKSSHHHFQDSHSPTDPPAPPQWAPSLGEIPESAPECERTPHSREGSEHHVSQYLKGKDQPYLGQPPSSLASYNRKGQMSSPVSEDMTYRLCLQKPLTWTSPP